MKTHTELKIWKKIKPKRSPGSQQIQPYSTDVSKKRKALQTSMRCKNTLFTDPIVAWIFNSMNYDPPSFEFIFIFFYFWNYNRYRKNISAADSNFVCGIGIGFFSCVFCEVVRFLFYPGEIGSLENKNGKNDWWDLGQFEVPDDAPAGMGGVPDGKFRYKEVKKKRKQKGNSKKTPHLPRTPPPTLHGVRRLSAESISSIQCNMPRAPTGIAGADHEWIVTLTWGSWWSRVQLELLGSVWFLMLQPTFCNMFLKKHACHVCKTRKNQLFLSSNINMWVNTHRPRRRPDHQGPPPPHTPVLRRANVEKKNATDIQ